MIRDELRPPALSTRGRRHRSRTWRVALSCGVAARWGAAAVRDAEERYVRSGTESSRRSVRSPVETASSRHFTTVRAGSSSGRGNRRFLMLQGGVRKARMEILRHRHRPGRDAGARARSGDRLRREPRVLAGGLDRLRSRHRPDPARGLPSAAIPAHDGRLAWAEAENLPFADATFDACWSVGGFNYYSDHEAALREMRRVTKPGGPVVVADEVPGLHRAGLGHLDRRAIPRCLVAAQAGARPRVRRHGPGIRRRPRGARQPRLAPGCRGTGSGTGWATVLSIQSLSSR